MKTPSFLLALPLAAVLAACAPAASQTSPAPVPQEEQATPQGRVIPVTAELWKFTPNVLRAQQSEEVVLQITGISGTHGFSAPDLGINATVIQGQTITVPLPTDKAGTFDFRCSVPCGVGHQDMKGQIVIAP